MENTVYEVAKCIHKETKKKYIVELVQDNFPMNPRLNDNLAKFNFLHNRYSFPYELQEVTDEYWKIPVYMINHSRLAFSTSSFSDKFDSGLLGFAYVHKNDVKDYEHALKIVDYELEEYERYTNGEIYGIVMSKFDEWGERNVIESLWGCCADLAR